MKLNACLLFLLTGTAIFWQCSDMISALSSARAGPAVMVVLWLPTIGLLLAGPLAFASLRAAAIAGAICLLPIIGFYALALLSTKSFSIAHDWSYAIPLSGIAASMIFVVRQFTVRKPYA